MSSVVIGSDRELSDLRRKIALQRQYINRLRLRVDQVRQELRTSGWEPPVEAAADEEEPAAPLAPKELSPKLLEEEMILYAEELHQLFVQSEQLQQRSNRMATEAARVVLTLQHVAAPELFAHAVRVARYADAIAVELGWDEGQRVTLRLAALCHDVGKLFAAGAAEGPDPHPELGAQLLGKVAALRTVAGVVRSHHERFDGCGFPDRLQGDTISLEAQVIAAGDAIDHTVGPTARAALSVEEILARLTDDDGAFAPAVMPALPGALRSLEQARLAGEGRRKRPTRT